jgi:GAF domain-containing protein
VAEAFLDVRHLDKSAAYAAVREHLSPVLAGCGDDIAAMASIACVLHQGFGHLWTGFYRVVSPSLLRVGPYQGALGCLEIAFGRGVCGAAAAERKTVIVDDVARFAGHIACDPRSRSEIVVPVLRGNALIAVLDIDSASLAAFDAVDARALEAMVASLS